MKQKIEKNIFIKRIIHNTKSLNSKKLTKSKFIQKTINHDYNNLKSKKCYIKPHPIFIISNTYNNNPFNIDIIPKNDKNFLYIKANNTERHKYFNVKKVIENKLKQKENNNERFCNIRSKSYEIPPLEHIIKIRKYFNDKSEKIKIEFSKDNLNSFDNERIFRNEKNISNNNHFHYKFNTLNIMEGRNKLELKSSKSKDIVKLCKVLNTLNKSYNKGSFIKEKNSKGGIINLSMDSVVKRKRKNKYEINIEKIIFIQKWWKEILYKRYVKFRISRIQAIFRGYIFRKSFLKFLYKLQKFSKYEFLNKIIFIQKFWKNYLSNKNQINMSFSFTNNEDNKANNNDFIYIENTNSNHDKDSKKENYILNHIQKSNALVKASFITKKFYSKYSSIISKINFIQKCFRKYLSNKQKNDIDNINIQNIYQKKNLNIIKLKSRNKIMNNGKNNNHFFKSLVIVSPEKEIQKFDFHTPKKEKNNKFRFDNEIIRDRAMKNIYNKQLNGFCFISKIRKNINLVQTIKILQKYIIKKIRKQNYCFSILKERNIGCFIDKAYGNNIINGNLKCKIIFLQKNIKRFLKMNKLNNNKYNSDISYQKPNIKNNKDILSMEKFQNTNYISDKKNEEKNSDKNIITSEFSLNDKINKDEENENIIISNNLNVFSFNFENTRNENIEEDDDDYALNMIENKIDNIKKRINFSSKNMLIYSEKNNSYKKLKSLFVSYITNKLAVFLTDIINKLLLYNFLKLFIQKTKKIVNQYVYYFIFNKQKQKNEIIYFTILKRHIKFNTNNISDNEIKNLLIKNINKCFQIYNENNESLQSIFIPYIDVIQENNLINTQLFINNDEEMINYFINFYNKEKESFLLNKYFLKDILNKYKLKNRNIFTITNYFDEIIELFSNNKLCKRCLCNNDKCICNNKTNKKSKLNYIKKKCNHISMITKKKNEEHNNNYQFFKMLVEDDNSLDEFKENDNFDFNRSLNNSHIINIGNNNFTNLLTYNNENSLNNHEYKFFDYLNIKCKNNKYNESLPMTHRSDLNSFRNNKKI